MAATWPLGSQRQGKYWPMDSWGQEHLDLWTHRSRCILTFGLTGAGGFWPLESQGQVILTPGLMRAGKSWHLDSGGQMNLDLWTHKSRWILTAGLTRAGSYWPLDSWGQVNLDLWTQKSRSILSPDSQDQMYLLSKEELLLLLFCFLNKLSQCKRHGVGL